MIPASSALVFVVCGGSWTFLAHTAFFVFRTPRRPSGWFLSLGFRPMRRVL